VTSADKKAQKMYLEFLKNNFPLFGIIAEEDDLFTKAEAQFDPNTGHAHYYYFSIDPLDGTKAFKRKQSTGFSTMLALIHECPEVGICKVIAACIGDPMTNEVFYTRVDSGRVHQLDNYSRDRQIISISKQNPTELYILLRDNPRAYSLLSRKLADGYGKHHFFKDYEIQGGSIGLSFAMLWKGQYGGLLLKEGPATVWDTAPIIGISENLGFVPMRYSKKFKRFYKSEFTMIAERKNIEQSETLIIHRNLVPRLRSWQDKL
jgi:fructose-1,6-bisphosphatase/inositol monophosphatase family enzyme